jgi:hypothetical protein
MEKRVKLIVGLACVAAVTLAMSTTSRANLLVDPGAEQEISAPNPNPTGLPGWSFFGGAGFLTTPNAHTGTNVVLTPGGGGGYSVPGAYQNIPASGGQTFTLSGWVYTPNVLVSNSNDFAILQMQFWSGAGYSNANGGAVGVNIGTPIGPGPSTVSLPQGTWTFASITAVAPAGASGVSAYGLDINADANATFYFDDLSLVPEPSSIALVLTGLFGLVAIARKRRA